MRIAYFSPLPPAASGIADYSAELLPYLAEDAEIVLFVDPNQSVEPWLAQRFPISSIATFPQQQATTPFDVALYHMGNDVRFHGAIFEMLQQEPGIVVLHEIVLHHTLAGLYLNRDEAEQYVALVRRFHGPVGEVVAQRVINGEAIDLSAFPLMEPVLEASRGVIVHSQYAARAVSLRRPDLPVAVIPHHLSLPLPSDDDPSADAVRRDLGLVGRFVVGSFGFVTEAKRPAVLLRAFARFQRRHPEAVCCLVGQNFPTLDLAGLTAEVRLPEDAVRITGRVPLDEFLRYMIAADVAVNLRYPTCGETSGSVMRLLGLGVPTIVSDVGAFSELPDDVCAKVSVDAWEEDTLVAILEALATDDTLRQAMGTNARRHIRTHHTLEGSAKAYSAFIEQVVAGEAEPAGSPTTSPAADVISDIGATLAGWWVTEHHDSLLRPIAQALAELGIPADPFKDDPD